MRYIGKIGNHRGCDVVAKAYLSQRNPYSEQYLLKNSCFVTPFVTNRRR